MLKIDDDLSCRLTNLTFVCTALILLMHLPFAGVSPRFLKGEIEFVTHLAVPIFFAMSGFFIAVRSNSDGWYGTLLKKRVRSLLVPYLAVCTLYILPLIVHNNILYAGNWLEHRLWFNWYTIKRVYGLTPEFHPACGPFWYIRCLLFFVVLSPVFVSIVRRSRTYAIVLLAALVLGVSLLQSTEFGITHGNEFYSFFSVRGLVFFVGGMTLAYWGVGLSKKHRIVLSCAFILCGEILRHGFAIHNIFLANLISIANWLMLAFGIFGLMPVFRLPKLLASGSFAMFAFHTMLYMAFAAVLSRLSLPTGIVGDLIAVAILSFTTLSCCLVAALLRKFCPTAAAILFGGR